MPKWTNDFQSLVKTIYEQIVLTGGVVTESAEVWDKEAGILCEVDILVRYEYAGHEFGFVVEFGIVQEMKQWSGLIVL